VDATGTGKTGRVADTENKESELRSCPDSMKYILTTIRYNCGCHWNWQSWLGSRQNWQGC